MDIIITGASGFVGRHLADYLKKNNHHIQTLSLKAADWESSVDLKAGAIIHLAGKAHDTADTSAASEYFRINTDLSKSVFDIFLASNIGDFIYFSSVKAVADTVDTVLTEEAIPDPKTPYGQSKLQAEAYILSQQLPAGKRIFIIRPCMIHGPGNKGNLNLLYNIVKKGIPYPLAAFENKRSFLSIGNLNFLILEMISHKEIISGVYNFADDESLSTNELVSLISGTVRKKPRLWKIPKKLVVTVAKTGDLLHFPLNSERLKKMTESYVVSNKKIKKALHLNKLPVTAAEGLERTIKSFTENN